MALSVHRLSIARCLAFGVLQAAGAALGESTALTARQRRFEDQVARPNSGYCRQLIEIEKTCTGACWQAKVRGMDSK